MQGDAPPEIITVAGREVAISNPDKVLFPDAGYTKLDLARYYVAVSDGALRGAGGRPNVLVRYPNGIDGEFFFQKRAPRSRPPWIDVVTLRFPSGRSAEEIVPRDAAALVWMANLACLELHPHPVRADDLDHPDELRVDLDPVPGVEWPQIRAVAAVVRATLDDFGLVGWPKTSGSRGMHIYVRIERRWTLRRGAPRRAGPRARGRAARAGISRPASGGRKSATACSSTTTRTRRIARSPLRTRCGRRPTRACRRRSPGTKSTRASRATSRCERCRRGSSRSAIAMPASIGSPCSLEPPARAGGTAAGRRPGRRAVAAALPEAGRARRPRVAPSTARRTPQPSARVEIGRARNKADALAGSRTLEGAPPRRRPASRARRRARRRDARPLSDVDAGSRQPAARPGGARPAQEALDPNDRSEDDWKGVNAAEWPHRKPSRARKES